jgi:hypothetical protein
MQNDPYAWSLDDEDDWDDHWQDNGGTGLAADTKTPGDMTVAAGFGEDDGNIIGGAGDFGTDGINIGDPGDPGDKGGTGEFDLGDRQDSTQDSYNEEFDLDTISQLSSADIHAMADAGDFSQKFALEALQIKHARDEKEIVAAADPRTPFAAGTAGRPGVFSYETRYSAPGRTENQ